ncbi:hypothetical protein UlMin_029174 [Ulmus minor]
MILHRISIIIFMLLSLSHKAHASLSNHAYPPESFNEHGLPQQLSMAESENGIKSVAGEDEIEAKIGSIMEKFRVLLGLKRVNLRWPSNGDSENFSPAPSPSPFSEVEAPAPAPAPAQLHHTHKHPYPIAHRFRGVPPHPHETHKTQKHGDRGRIRRILIAVLVSAGAATLICVLGFLWRAKKYQKLHKNPTRTMPTYGKRRGRSKYLSFKNKPSKVSLNPSLDPFYLDSLALDLEQPQSSSLKQTSETLNSSPSHSIPNSPLLDREEYLQESMKPEFDNTSTSSTREIMSVHEDADNCYSSPMGEKFVPIEQDSSDDESFHSFGDSNSSNIRLSNVSVGSLRENLENLDTNVMYKTSCLVPCLSVENQQATPPPQNPSPALVLQSPSNVEHDKLPTATSSSMTPSLPPLAPPTPPPPPPPPPPRVPFLSSRSSPGSTKFKPRTSVSSPLSSLSSPMTLDSQSQSNQTLKDDVPSSTQSLSKPSKPPSCIPTPPCPPPLFNTNSKSFKGPPPPPIPSQLPQFSSLGKDGTPLPKLKPLHWDKVRAQPDRSMVWDKIRTSSFEFDEEMIESLFGYNLQNSMKNDEAKSKTPSPSKHVLEPKRLQNITILSKALNVTVEQVCEALIQGNGLSLQQLEALVKMVPTKEEEAKLSGYEGDVNELGSAENFVKAMLKVPFAFLRVEAMLYRETFEDEVVHLRNSFSMLEEACKELRSSRLFLKLLEAVLKTGNRMNVGTIRGGASAFKLDALLKLSDVKGTDGKTTLLHFVVQEITRAEGIRVSDSIMGRINQRNTSKTQEQKEEDYRRMGLDLVSGLSTELYNVKKTAAIDIDVLANSVSNLSNGMEKLRNLVYKDLSMDEQSGNFVNSINSFLGYAEKNLKELQGDESRVLSQVKEITEYFHGDVSKEEANPLRIFVIVRDFLGMLDHVCKELRSSKASRCPNPVSPFR